MQNKKTEGLIYLCIHILNSWMKSEQINGKLGKEKLKQVLPYKSSHYANNYRKHAQNFRKTLYSTCGIILMNYVYSIN